MIPSICIMVLCSCFLFKVTNAKSPILIFSPAEMKAVNELRTSLNEELTAPHMKSDAFLMKWLKGVTGQMHYQAKDFDMVKAKESLEQMMEWRKKIDADNLPLKDVSKFDRNYAIDFETTRDTSGRPVILMPIGQWDFRSAASKGRILDVVKRTAYMDEKATQLSFNLTGDPSPMLIVDLQGFSTKKHLCPACAQFFLIAPFYHEKYYPCNYRSIVVINSPPSFDAAYRLFRPLLTKCTAENLEFFGYNMADWTKVIYKTVSPDQLPVRYGGIRNHSHKI